MKIKILLFIAIFSVLGCVKEKNDSIPHGYFTAESGNWAWVPHHIGWIIDSGGTVRSFNLPDNWNWVDSSGYISESDIIDNILSCDSIIDKISLTTLNKYNDLIIGAANGEISEKKNIRNDSGSVEYYCYQYDTNSGLYKKILIDIDGDWKYYNKSNEAKEILRWMKTLW